MTKSQVQKNNANLLSEQPRLKHEWNHAVGWLNNLRYGIADEGLRRRRRAGFWPQWREWPRKRGEPALKP